MENHTTSIARLKTGYPVNFQTGKINKSVYVTWNIPKHADVKVESQWHWESPYHETEWIICEIVHLACLFVAIYILYALIHFYMAQPRKHNYSGRSSGSRWLEKMCILSVVVAICRFVNNQVLLIRGWQERDRCSTLLNVSIALYFLALHPVYLFLWIRQRIFYSNRALKHLYNKVVRFFSLATILCFFIVTGVSMVLFVVDRRNSASGRVCDDHFEPSPRGGANSSNRVTGLVNDHVVLSEYSYSNRTSSPHTQGVKVNTIAGLCGGAIQISFLALFLYPIMDNKLRAVRNHNMRCHHSLLHLIRRAFLLSGVCILSDIAIALGVKGVHSGFPKAKFAPLAMYDINLIINIVCIVATFRRWRRMLFPCLYNCFGGHLIRSTSKKYQFERRSIGLDTTNGGNARSAADFDCKEEQKEVEWKSVKAPVVDAMLDYDCEISEQEQKIGTTGNEENENQDDGLVIGNNNNDKSSIQCYSATSPVKMMRKRSRKEFKSRRSTTSERNRPMLSETITMTTEAPFYATSRFSLRSKKTNNVVTTKLVVKSEAYMWRAMNGENASSK